MKYVEGDEGVQDPLKGRHRWEGWSAKRYQANVDVCGATVIHYGRSSKVKSLRVAKSEGLGKGRLRDGIGIEQVECLQPSMAGFRCARRILGEGCDFDEVIIIRRVRAS